MGMHDKKRSKSFKSLVLLTLLGPSLLFAFDENERIPVGTREMSPEAIEQIEKQRELENQDSSQENLPKFAFEGKEEARCGFIFDRYPPVYFPASAHWLIGVSAFGDSVELEDGSVWKINSYDGYKALNWRSNDPLLVTQNSRWFSKYPFRIINKSTGSSLEAELFLGPIKEGVYTHYIVALDPVRGEIMLNDNTHWEVSSYDSYTFRDWAPNDAVIIGYNSGWDSSCDTLLINVNMNNFVRAKQY